MIREIMFFAFFIMVLESYDKSIILFLVSIIGLIISVKTIINKDIKNNVI